MTAVTFQQDDSHINAIYMQYFELGLVSDVVAQYFNHF